MKIPLVEAELFHADARTNMTNLIVAFAILRMHLKMSCTSQAVYWLA